MGTPEFAVPTLRALVDAGHEIAAVVTQPDRPRGRGMAVTPSPVKQFALERGLPVYQPVKIREEEAVERIRDFAPDVIVVVAFGQILPTALLYRNMAPCGSINLHASLLPKYRGPAPINRAILNGDRVTGSTTMYITEQVDSGAILLRNELEILPTDTAASLGRRMAEAGGGLMVETLRMAVEGKLEPIEQDPDLVTYAPMLKKEDGEIDWRLGASEIDCRVRGLHPWPGTYTWQEDRMLKILKVSVVNDDAVEGAPGSILRIGPDGMLVAAGRGGLLVKDVQPPGRGMMAARDYCAGHGVRAGMLLGRRA